MKNSKEKLNVDSSKTFLSSGNLEKSQHQGEETLNKFLTTEPEENNLETKMAQMEENIFALMKKQKKLIKELDSLKDLITYSFDEFSQTLVSFIDKNSEQNKKDEEKTDNKEIIPFGRTMINKQNKTEIESDLDDNQIKDPLLKYDDYFNSLYGIWNSGQRVKVRNYYYQLVDKDFLSLKPGKWLNDNVGKK